MIERYKKALELIAGEDCPPWSEDEEWNCVKDGKRCIDCMTRIAKEALDESICNS